MKKGLIIFLALCALAAAMVPRERESSSTISTSTTMKPKNICAPRTPCAWSMYKRDYKIIEYTIENTYCECGVGMQCQIDEDESTANAYIHHCKPPSDPEEASES